MKSTSWSPQAWAGSIVPGAAAISTVSGAPLAEEVGAEELHAEETSRTAAARASAGLRSTQEFDARTMKLLLAPTARQPNVSTLASAVLYITEPRRSVKGIWGSREPREI